MYIIPRVRAEHRFPLQLAQGLIKRHPMHAEQVRQLLLVQPRRHAGIRSAPVVPHT